MRFTCKSCGKNYNLPSDIKCCPYCGSAKIVAAGKASAEEMIKEFNSLSAKMDKLMQQYIPLYLESECILSKLRVYKRRKIISPEELPERKTYNMQAMLSEYRKNKKES